MRTTRLHVVLIAAASVALGAQAREPVVRVIAPEADGYISGPTTLRAEVNPLTTPIARVSFFADGQLVCAVDRRPFECPWDAGPGVTEHQIRVVAVTKSGARLVQTLRTRSLAYAEAVEVDAVLVTVTVTDDKGEFVKRLPREAFRIWEDDVLQRADYFASSDVPLELTAAIDVSGSMSDSMPELKNAVKRFIGALRPIDKVTLLAFNDNVFTLARASVDPPSRIRAVDRLAGWGGTALYDVLVRAVEGLSRQLGRRILVTFSDGEDTASHIPLTTAERRLQMSDATIYTIAQGRATRVQALRDVLNRLAKTSGGRAFVANDIEQLAAAFDAIVLELTNQYLLAYTPRVSRRDGAWHRIRVEVTPNRYQVRAREGYWAPGSVGQEREP